ncbi:myoneurin-like [Protopterus annectens]|uniref:myoneurin-like n=1 Tax=Protopterus annectens TaxID=7888 RepID=UPI001CFA52D5|nr:myoneurin-like [Protopterus annectens]XP_043940326.1 myoneurin-like [Protopterus annectens]XP_043940327.1 myoneurin-like [Protopterus annectens]
MPATSAFKPTLPAKKKCVAVACTQTDDIPEELTFDDASCQTDPVTDEPSWSDVSCQTERSEEATKILLELLGPDYFDWRPNPQKPESPSVPPNDGAANELTIKREKCVMKPEDIVVKQQGDTDHDYAAVVRVTNKLLRGALPASLKEEPAENCGHAELPTNTVTVQTPVIQSTVSLNSSTVRPSPVIQATICMNSSDVKQPPVTDPTVITNRSVISQQSVAQTTVQTIPLQQLSTGPIASKPGHKEGDLGKKKKIVVAIPNRRPRPISARDVESLIPKERSEMNYDYKELAHLWKQLPLESKRALAMADHRYLLTEERQGSNFPRRGKLDRKLYNKYTPKTLKEIINVEGLPLYEDVPSLGERSPAEVTIRLYTEDDNCSEKKGRGRGRKRKGTRGRPAVNRVTEKGKDNALQVCSTKKRAARNDDYEPLQLEVTAEEEMNERFARSPEYRCEEFAESSTTEDSQEELEDASEEEEEEWNREPSEDEVDKTDKKDDDYNPWSENESSSESEVEKCSSSEMDLFSNSDSFSDSDSDSLSDSSLKEPVEERHEVAPLTRRRRSLRLQKKSKPDVALDQEDEEMDEASEDSADSREEPGSFSLMCLSPKKYYKCKYCDIKFRKKLWMKHHLHLTHLKVKYKPFKCSYENCKKRFILKKKMKKHIKNVHETVSNPEEQEFLCTYAGCNKVFRSKQRLNIHVQIHSDTRGWVCKECGKTFKLQKCLSMHMKIHTGEKRLQCSVCGELFRQKASLNWHMTKHEESCNSFFKVSCDVCGKKFEKEKGLEAHMIKVHGKTSV